MSENTKMNMRDAINLALDQALAADDSVIVLGEDVADPAGGVSGVTAGLSTKYGSDRVLDTPISEQAIIGAAVGAALEGLRPVAEIMMMDFIGICLDQIANHAAKLRFMTAGRTTVPLTIRTAVFEGLGSGATHSQSLEAWLMHVPGLKVAMPSTPHDAKGLTASAIRDDDPCVLIETARLYHTPGPVPVEHYTIPFGSADRKRAGSDVTIVAHGAAVLDALAAAEQLAPQGIDAEVIDLRSLVPLDTRTVLESVRRTRRAVIAHHATRFAGPGAEVAAIIAAECFDILQAPVRRVGARFVPIPSAANLEQLVLPDADRVASAVRAVMEYRGARRG